MPQRLQQRQVVATLLALLLALLFIVAFYWLNSQQYLSFQVRSPDADRFDQAIWNTLHGRFMFSSIINRSILEFHFSPIMALLSPLLLLWSDIRILYLAQIVGIAVAGLILYLIVKEKNPWLAILFLLAYYLNPTLHQITLLELRRVTLAIPFIALMLYGLYKENRPLMLAGAIMTLLCKEDLGLIVGMVGLFLLIFRRDWQWGLPITILGFGWTLSMTFWVLPRLAGEYTQTVYYDEWGNSMLEIVINMATHPLQVLQVMFDTASLQAIWKVLLPVAVILPFLGADYLLIAVPLLALMLASSEPAMHELRRWYLAPILPILFTAVAIGISRLPRRYFPWSLAALILATLISYRIFSPAPFGALYQPYRYEVTDRHRRAWEIVRTIPPDAKVAAQQAFITALAHREHIYNYPWYHIDESELDYFILGEGFNAYPVGSDDIYWEIFNKVADPNLTIEAEADGIYLFRQGGNPLPSIPLDRVAEDAIKLERAEVAVADEEGFYRPVTEQKPPLQPGQTIRVTLYWEALAAPEAERTVSVRLADSSGSLIAQQDMLPSYGSRPTSWWKPGWYFRDVYYLTVAPETNSGLASLDLVLYDTFSGERILFGDDEIIHIMDFVIAD